MRTTRAVTLTCILSVAWAAGPCFVLPAVGAAHAATDEEKAGARALAEQAIQEAYPQGQYDQVVDLLRRAEALVHSPTHWLYIGMAQAKLGHLVLAREAFLKASREPIDDNSPEAFKVVVQTASNELEALKPRLAKVTIRLVGVEPSTATVRVDGTQVPNALVGVSMPVDPGERVFEASAPGMVTATQKLVVSEGSTANLELVLVADPSAPPPPVEGGSTTTTVGGDSGAASSGTSTKDILFYTGLGGAVLGAGGLVGGYLVYSGGADPRANADDLYSACHQPTQGRECTVVEQDQITSWDNDADSAEIPGKILMITGGVLLGAGATLIVVSLLQDDEPAEPQMGLSVTPWVGVNGAGLFGTF
jgi:hypothetical protein